MRIATELLATRPAGRFAFNTRWLITDIHVAREDLAALQELGDAGNERAELALYRILGDREDVNALTGHVERGRRRAIPELVRVHERRGDLDALLTLFRHGYGESERPLALLCGERGAHDHVAELAEKGSSTARGLLVEAAVAAGDRESLTGYATRGWEGAAHPLNLLLAAHGDTAALRGRAGHGDSHAVAKLADVFVERGDTAGMRELVAAFPHHDALPWRFAELLAAQGRSGELRSVLHQIIASQRLRPADPLAGRLADAGDVDGLRTRLWCREGVATAATPAPETVEWVVLAVTSGVLGNAAYAGLNAAIKKLWSRMQKRRTSSSADVVEPESAEPVWHTAREALEAACLAVDEHCTRIEVAVPDFTQVSYEVQHLRGRWVFTFREPTSQGGRRFRVSVPPRPEGSSRSLVMMQVPRRTAGSSIDNLF
jgi:hypothetical protein